MGLNDPFLPEEEREKKTPQYKYDGCDKCVFLIRLNKSDIYICNSQTLFTVVSGEDQEEDLDIIEDIEQIKENRWSRLGYQTAKEKGFI